MKLPVWKCQTCGCLWRDNLDETVSLLNAEQKSCPSCEHSPTRKACAIYWLPVELLSARRVDPRSRFGTLTLGGEWADGARPFYFRATGDEGPVEPAGQVQGAEAAAALGEAFALFNAQGVGETRPEIPKP